MKKIKQLGNFLCDDGTNLPIRGRLFSARGCSPTIYNFGSGGGAGIKNSRMEVNILVNGTVAECGICRAIRASYGKCGYASLRLHTGQGITGVATYRKECL